MGLQISGTLVVLQEGAFCFGVHAIIIPDNGVGALNEDAILTQRVRWNK
jgi:hypothetical protein